MDFLVNMVNLLPLIGIYAMLALSLNVIVGLTGLLQLGHVGFFAVGAYTAGLISIYATVPELGAGNLVIGSAGAMAMAALFAVLIGLPCLRLRGDYLAIATLGFGEILRMTLANVEFPKAAITDGAFGGATGILLPNPIFHAVDYRVDYAPGWLIWLVLAAMFVFLLNLKRSDVGRAMLCIRADEIAARAMGIQPPKYKMLAFLISAVCAGLAGALLVHNPTFGLRASPGDFGLLKTLELLLMVVLGGLGSMTGSLLAAALLVVLPELLRFLPPIAGIEIAQHRQLLYAVLLIVLIRLMPNGMLGLKELPGWLRGAKARTGGRT